MPVGLFMRKEARTRNESAQTKPKRRDARDECASLRASETRVRASMVQSGGLVVVCFVWHYWFVPSALLLLEIHEPSAMRQTIKSPERTYPARKEITRKRVPAHDERAMRAKERARECPESRKR